MSDGYIYIKGWDQFQHPDVVRSNRMPWIRVYVDLLDNDAYWGLSVFDRGILQALWLLTARTGQGRCSASASYLQRQCCAPAGHVQRSIKRLNDAGFIEVLASKAQAPRKRDASLEGEEGSKEPSKKESARANGAHSRGAAAARQTVLANAIAGARELTQGEPPHLAEDTIRKAGYDEDILPDILAALVKPAPKEGTVSALKRVDL